MYLRMFKFARLAVLFALVAMSIGPRFSRPLPNDLGSLAKAPYEVRLRKLHLVRPDLIPFPVFFEVYC